MHELLPIVEGLQAKHLDYLSAIVGLELGLQANEIEVLYFFCPEDAHIVLRVRVPRQNGSLPSLCEIAASAEVFDANCGRCSASRSPACMKPSTSICRTIGRMAFILYSRISIQA